MSSSINKHILELKRSYQFLEEENKERKQEIKKLNQEMKKLNQENKEMKDFLKELQEERQEAELAVYTGEIILFLERLIIKEVFETTRPDEYRELDIGYLKHNHTELTEEEQEKYANVFTKLSIDNEFLRRIKPFKRERNHRSHKTPKQSYAQLLTTLHKFCDVFLSEHNNMNKDNARKVIKAIQTLHPDDFPFGRP